MTAAAPRTAILIVSLLLASAAVALAGCDGEPEAETPITISQGSAPDSLDPALAAEAGGFEPLWLVYTPLLTYRHAEGEKGAELIPGLASDLPEISADGRTYSLTLREGLEYSDGSPVQAGDFEHAIARVLYLDSPGARFYEGISGALAFQAADDPKATIAGIETNDETGTIEITLTAPDPNFAGALALTFAGLVPPRTPFRDLTSDPPPGVGPYAISESDPDGGFVLSRNSGFAELDIPDIPTGNIAEITTRVVPGTRQQAQDVLDGKLDYMQDPPPVRLRRTILEQAGDRFSEHPLPSTTYVSFDRRAAPFDDPLVREAVNRALNRSAIAAAYGGRMQPGCAYLAPGVPGYDRSLDTADCPYGDPAQAPDLGTARDLIEQAGARGAAVRVGAGTGAEEREAVTRYARTLEAIGLEATIANCDACAQTSIVTEAPEFPRPLEFFGALGPDDPLISSQVDRLSAAIDPGSEAWRELDRYLVSPPQGYVATIGHATVATFFSERMDPGSAIFHPVFRNDYSSWQLKEGE